MVEETALSNTPVPFPTTPPGGQEPGPSVCSLVGLVTAFLRRLDAADSVISFWIHFPFLIRVLIFKHRLQIITTKYKITLEANLKHLET